MITSRRTAPAPRSAVGTAPLVITSERRSGTVRRKKLERGRKWKKSESFVCLFSDDLLIK